MKQTLVLTTWLALSSVGCASASRSYDYVPVTSATLTVHERQAAADYAVPPDAPSGDVRVRSLGIRDLGGGPHPSAREVRLQLTLVNKGAEPWAFDVRQQRLDAHTENPPTTTVVDASSGTAPPVITVPPNGTRVADLRFVLPTTAQIPGFDLRWQVNVGARKVTQTTAFRGRAVNGEGATNAQGGDESLSRAASTGPATSTRPLLVSLRLRERPMYCGSGVWAESEVGKGTNVSFTMPVVSPSRA